MKQKPCGTAIAARRRDSQSIIPDDIDRSVLCGLCVLVHRQQSHLEMSKFEQEFERKPSLDEMVDRVDLPEDKIEDAMKASSTSRHLSVDAPFSDDEEGSMLDLLANSDDPTDNELLTESLRAEIERLLKTLPDKDQKIIAAFYGIGTPELTLEEIGTKYHLTRERVRQIKEKTIRRLRNKTTDKLLKSYLG